MQFILKVIDKDGEILEERGNPKDGYEIDREKTSEQIKYQFESAYSFLVHKWSAKKLQGMLDKDTFCKECFDFYKYKPDEICHICPVEDSTKPQRRKVKNYKSNFMNAKGKAWEVKKVL